MTPVIASYFCCIITILVLIVKLHQENNPIESIYTRTMYFFEHDVKRLHRLIWNDSFVLLLRYCVNLKAIRYKSTSFNRIVADKLHCVIAP